MENSEKVVACFRALLQRAPSEGERRVFETNMINGLTLDGLIERILGGPEFREGPRASAEFVPAGHFYSAIPSTQTRDNAAQQWVAQREQRKLPGITLDETTMRAHFNRMTAEATRYPFPAQKNERWRYHYDNPAYAYADGLSLYTMIRHLRPQRIIEVGSGYSSSLMLDVNEREFDNRIEVTFIEPHPGLLRSLFREQDCVQVKLHATPVQTTDVALFDGLEANDILFIDSTHVAKLGSDVNHLYSRCCLAFGRASAFISMTFFGLLNTRRSGLRKDEPGTKPICCVRCCSRPMPGKSFTSLTMRTSCTQRRSGNICHSSLRTAVAMYG